MIVGVDGAVESIVIVKVSDVAAFPAVSDSVTLIAHMPSESVPSVHALEEIVQDTVLEPAFVALTFAVPVNVPEAFIVGVVTLVMSSEFEDPESDASARSGVAGVEIVALLITTLDNAVLESELIPSRDWTAVSE